MRQLSKQRSIQEPDEEMPKQKTVLIQEEKAEIGMVHIVCVWRGGGGRWWVGVWVCAAYLVTSLAQVKNENCPGAHSTHLP